MATPRTSTYSADSGSGVYAGIPQSFIPSVGQRANINAGGASEVDYDLTSGVPLAGRWWNGYQGAGSFGSMVSSYSGSVWAPQYGPAGAIVVHGGGHGGQIGAFAYAFDMATRRWVCIGAPGNVPATSVWCGYTDARVSTTYDAGIDLRGTDYLDYDFGGSYIKIADHCYLQNGYVPPGLGGGTHGSLLLPESHYTQTAGQPDTRPGGSAQGARWAPHLLDLETGVMSRAAAAPFSDWPGYATIATVMDSTRGRMWFFMNGNPAQAYYHELDGGPPYARVAHSVQKASGGGADWLPVANCTWLYVPEADAIVAFSPANQNSLPPAVPNSMLSVYVFGMSAGAPVDLERSAAVGTRSMPFGGMYVGAAWHPTLQRFYLYEGYGDEFLYTLTPSSLDFAACTWAWGREQFDNAHDGADPVFRSAFVAGNGQITAPLGKLVYVPEYDCLAWHDGPTTSAQCYDGVTRGGIVQLLRAPGTQI